MGDYCLFIVPKFDRKYCFVIYNEKPVSRNRVDKVHICTTDTSIQNVLEKPNCLSIDMLLLRHNLSAVMYLLAFFCSWVFMWFSVVDELPGVVLFPRQTVWKLAISSVLFTPLYQYVFLTICWTVMHNKSSILPACSIFAQGTEPASGNIFIALGQPVPGPVQPYSAINCFTESSININKL